MTPLSVLEHSLSALKLDFQFQSSPSLKYICLKLLLRVSRYTVSIPKFGYFNNTIPKGNRMGFGYAEF